MERLSRRDFLRVSAFVAAGSLAAACVQPGATEPAPAGAAAQATTAPAGAAPAAASRESPMLADLVAQGKLPPLDERIPKNPFVPVAIDGIGKFGGTMRKSFSGQFDTSVIYKIVDKGMVELNHEFVWRPCVAESYSVNDDATEYVFHLREGMKWSDGEPITTEDYRFYFEDWQSNRDLNPVQAEALCSVVEGERVPAVFAAPDDFTVSYTFVQPKGLFLLTSEIREGPPFIAAHYYKKFHIAYTDKAELDKIAKELNVEGWVALFDLKIDYLQQVDAPLHMPWIPKNPFVDEFVVYERNPYYWEVDAEGNQLPYIDKVTFRLFKDPQVNMMWAMNGELDCLARALLNTPEDLSVLKQNETTGDYTLMLWKDAGPSGVYFNLTAKEPRVRELFQARDFRIAISHAANRDQMRQQLLNGAGRNTQASPPPTTPYYCAKLAEAYLEYDPDKANALLDGLGYTERDSDGYRLWKDGSGERLSFVNYKNGTTQSPEELLLTDNFKAVGLDMLFKGVDRSLSKEAWWSNEAQMCVEGERSSLVPLASMFIWVTGNTGKRAWANCWATWRAEPNNPIAEKPPEGHWIWNIWSAWEELQRTTGDEAQKQVLFKILDIWATELPAVGLITDYPVPIVVKNGLKGLTGTDGFPWDNGPTRYEYMVDPATWYWEEPAKHTG